MAYYERQPLSQPPKVEKKEAKSPGGNWAVLVFLLLTVLASLFFWARRELPEKLKNIFGPVTLFSTQVEEEFDPDPVLAETQFLVSELEGSYGVYVYRFSDSQEYGLNQDQVFTAASLDKLPVMLALYQEAEAGRVELNEALQGHALRMGKSSDNEAKAALVELLGEDKIQETIDDLGMEKTSFSNNQTTPADIGLFFRQLYQGGVISDEHRDEILQFLTETDFEDRIPAGVSEGVRVAHKVGTEEGSFSDAGIVFADEPYTLVIMSDDALGAEAAKTLPAISRIVWGSRE